jgi:isoleucyl-tRNA synthetase
VHLADFPAVRDLEGNLTPELVSEWSRLLTLRDAVNADIERKRKDKVIGNSLGASVEISAAGEDYELLHRYRSELPMVFIVSSVNLRRTEGPTSGVTIMTRPADGVKCARCWRYVSEETGQEGICERCAEAIVESVGS